MSAEALPPPSAAGTTTEPPERASSVAAELALVRGWIRALPWWVFVLALIAAAALGLRMNGLDWDGGNLYHPDERSIYLRADCMYRVLTEAPGWESCQNHDFPQDEPGFPGVGAFPRQGREPAQSALVPAGHHHHLSAGGHPVPDGAVHGSGAPAGHGVGGAGAGGVRGHRIGAAAVLLGASSVRDGRGAARVGAGGVHSLQRAGDALLPPGVVRRAAGARGVLVDAERAGARTPNGITPCWGSSSG